jgi:deazaflavin-dependent oxidoreductase (nitroreductase family)
MTTSDRDPSATEYAFQQEQERDTVAEEDYLAGPGDTDSAGYDYGAIAPALAIGPDSTAPERTIDITTLGARSGIPRRIEVWLHRVDGRWYLTGMPRPRSWYANVRAHPRFTVHLKHGVTADLPATAAPVTELTRRRVITAVLDLQNRPDIAARVSRRQELDDWLARSPLVEIVFDDERLRTSSSARSG